MIKSRGTALFKEEYPPVFGFQDRGKSPGGVLDRFSLEIARALLGTKNPGCYCLIFGRELEVQENVYLFITGAKYRSITCAGEQVPMNVVFKAKKNTVLEFEEKAMGFRTYLYALPLNDATDDILGRERGDYRSVFSWVAGDGSIRVLPGPESGQLSSMDQLEGTWTVGRNSNDMGLRLQRETFVPPENLSSMISQPVVDGCIQLTPNGPLLLLRERQTIGGYPRVAVVINADIDLLAQYGPGDTIAFSVVSAAEAERAFKAKRECIAGLKKALAQASP